MPRIVTTTLRVPEDILAHLKHQAINNKRSLNSEILLILEEALKRKDQGYANAAA
ncbi:Arc family DNA-binding protein [Chromobacterium vaccinii]|uniref:Arc family DNA-binding protein n=1 Tax=Chromobacterium vaccinii TaxID=1108595 RepID=UPI003C7187A8